MPSKLLSIPVVASISVAWNIVMTFVAIAIDAPSQFGIRGTDPAKEWVTSGTAISAPPLPLVLLIVGALLSTRRGIARLLGLLLVVAAASLFVIGGIGELAAEPTSQTSHGELVFGGVVALLFAAWLLICVAASIRSRRSRSRS